MTQEEEFKVQNYTAMENRLMSANSDAYHAQANLEIAQDQLKQRDETIKQLKQALKDCIEELMYVSTTGHLWMWARSNGKVPERLLNARKLIEDELNKT